MYLSVLLFETKRDLRDVVNVSHVACDCKYVVGESVDKRDDVVLRRDWIGLVKCDDASFSAAANCTGEIEVGEGRNVARCDEECNRVQVLRVVVNLFFEKSDGIRGQGD